MAFQRGTYRVRGDVIDVFPAESEKEAVRVELFDDVIDNIATFDPLTGEVLARVPRYTVFPEDPLRDAQGTHPRGAGRDPGRVGRTFDGPERTPTSSSRRSAWSSAPGSISR